jgi:hypothetical protein
MLRFAHKTKNRAAAPSPDYAPPMVVTLVRGRSHRVYQQLTEWEPPPGADDHKFLRHTVVCPSVRRGLITRSLSDSVVIHDPNSLDCHSLNRTAAEIVRLADGTRNLASIARDYTRRFGVDADTAWNDVLLTLEDLLDRKLIVTRSR